MAGMTSLQQVLLERGEGGRGGVDVSFGPVVLLGAAIRHDDDHRHGLPVRKQVVQQEVGRGEALPLRLVAADAVQQIEDRVFLVRGVARRRIDLHLAPRPTDLESYSIISSLPCGISARFALMLAGGSGYACTSSGFSTMGPPKPPGPLAAGGSPAAWPALCSLKEQGRELVQAAPPGQPFVRRAGRLVEDRLDAGLRQLVVVAADAVLHPLRLRRADAQEEQVHPPVEGVRVRHDAVVRRLRVERAAAKSAARAAEAADRREEVRDGSGRS